MQKWNWVFGVVTCVMGSSRPVGYECRVEFLKQILIGLVRYWYSGSNRRVVGCGKSVQVFVDIIVRWYVYVWW